MRLPARLGWAALVVAACAPSRAGPEGRSMDIFVDATRGDHLGMRLVVTGLEEGEPFWMKRIVEPDQVALEDVVLETLDGRPIPSEVKGARWIVSGVPGDTVVARYRAVPGGRGRHGHQGLITPDWMGFDGRSLLYPVGIQAFDHIRWHFELPEGWEVAGPLIARDDGSWDMPALSPRHRASVLQSLCLGLGPFEGDLRQVGGADLRVYAYGPWDDGEQLRNGAHAMFRWFHDQLGFAPAHPFALVWTPPGEQMAAVWSGAGALGACYERPQGGVRNWELLGHRIAHPLNEYPPHGFHIGPSRDHWFMEGWASYIEILAVAAAGLAPDEGRFTDLLEQHHAELARHPAWSEVRLADELDLRGDLIENVHYRRGPLVVRMLADVVRRRSATDLEAFMRHVIDVHGDFQSTLDLRAELGAFTGAPLDDFWAAMVDGAGPVVPVWAEIAHEIAPGDDAPALRAGELTWSGRQLHEIGRTGRFTGAIELVERLRETGRQHGELNRRGVRVLPPEVDALRLALPGHLRADVDALERMWPLSGGPAAPSGGCRGAPAPVELPVVEALDDDGRTLLALAEAEAGATWELSGRDGLLDVRFALEDQRGGPRTSVVAVAKDEDLRVRLRWAAPLHGVQLDVLQGGQKVGGRWAEVHPNWPDSWFRLGREHFGKRTGLFEVQVLSDGRVLASRPVWRR